MGIGPSKLQNATKKARFIKKMDFWGLITCLDRVPARGTLQFFSSLPEVAVRGCLLGLLRAKIS